MVTRAARVLQWSGWLLALLAITAPGWAQEVPSTGLVCSPKGLANEVVASPQQRLVAGREAQPSITDANNGFAWPDTPMGVSKTAKAYLFFASDGGYHPRQLWQGEWVGNNKAGSVVTTVASQTIRSARAARKTGAFPPIRIPR